GIPPHTAGRRAIVRTTTSHRGLIRIAPRALRGLGRRDRRSRSRRGRGGGCRAAAAAARSPGQGQLRERDSHERGETDTLQHETPPLLMKCGSTKDRGDELPHIVAAEESSLQQSLGCPAWNDSPQNGRYTGSLGSCKTSKHKPCKLVIREAADEKSP